MNVGLFVGFLERFCCSPRAHEAVLAPNGHSCHVLGGVECSHLSPLTTNYSRRLRRSQATQCMTALINEALIALIEREGASEWRGADGDSLAQIPKRPPVRKA